MDIIEKVARAICLADGVDPDGIGYAIRAETMNSFGASYPLWKMRIRQAEAAIKALAL